MIEVTPRLVFLVLFLTGLVIFLYLDRNKVERHYILFYRRTKRGINLLDRIAKKAPRLWNYYGWAGVATGFVSMIVSFLLIAQVVKDMAVTKSVENGPSLILPGLVSENQFQAGVSFIPVEYWVIGIGILMVAHEMSHGIVARAEDFELNSVGWIVMGIFPGAFVEPKGERMLPGDEGEITSGEGMWDQGDWRSRLKVLGAGSFANYVVAAVFLLGAIGFTTAITAPSNVFYVTDEGFPAAEAGLTNGTLYSVNGEEIESIQDLQRVSSDIQVGDSVSLDTSEINVTVTAVERENYDGGYIGIRVGQNTVVKDAYSEYQAGLQWFISLLWTVGLLNFLIGLFNMLPFKPLDGGLMAETVLERYRPDWMKYLNTFSLAGWAFLLTALFTSIVIGAI